MEIFIVFLWSCWYHMTRSKSRTYLYSRIDQWVTFLTSSRFLVSGILYRSWFAAAARDCSLCWWFWGDLSVVSTILNIHFEWLFMNLTFISILTSTILLELLLTAWNVLGSLYTWRKTLLVCTALHDLETAHRLMRSQHQQQAQIMLLLTVRMSRWEECSIHLFRERRRKQTNNHQGMTGGMSGMTMREEPECIKKWKLEQEEMLKKKDADEEVKIRKWYEYEKGERLKRYSR